MEETRKKLIEDSIEVINRDYKRVLIMNVYEGSEYRRLKMALEILMKYMEEKEWN